MRFKTYVFWEPVISPHKAEFLEAFAKKCRDARVICVAHEDLTEDRKLQGWAVAIPMGYEQVVAPSASQISSLVDGEPDVLHIFSGIRHVPTIVEGLRFVKARFAQFAIMSEPRITGGLTGVLRYFQSWLTEGWLRRRVAFVLAIGRNGPPWFRAVGYRADRILPFAYFINGHAQLVSLVGRATNEIVTVGFVGRVERQKGIHDVIEALGSCTNTKLIVVGTGDLDGKVRSRARVLGLCVDFLGVKPISAIPALMKQMDVLVLPSISKDGWGVVVSEALLAGTAVIATSCVGASILLDDPVFGIQTEPNCPRQIVHALEVLKQSGAYTEAARIRRQARANDLLTADAGAAYLIEIIDYIFFDSERPMLFEK